MVAMILMRTVYRDIARYNRVPTSDKEDEVCRNPAIDPPRVPLLLVP